jgi:hypothetical protein
LDKDSRFIFKFLSLPNQKSQIANQKLAESIVVAPDWLLALQRGSWLAGGGEYIKPTSKKEITFGFGYDERIAGGWRTFRPPGKALEPEDEGIHFRRA